MENLEITVEELQDILENNKPIKIIDIRPQEHRDEWYIPESEHLDVYKQIEAGEDDIFDNVELPVDKPIILVCIEGLISKDGADILQEKGYKAYSLKGGMKQWNFAYSTKLLENKENDLKIFQIRRVAKGCISYLIISKDEAVVIDASLSPEVYISLANKNHSTIKYVMDTHTHADYISRTRELAKTSNTKHIFIDIAQVDYDYIKVKDRENIYFGNSVIKIIHTPGHTLDSVSYLLNNEYLFTGDTLFVDGIGRPDLKANIDETIYKAGLLYDSLQYILSLDENINILPSHYSNSIAFAQPIIINKIGEISKNVNILSFNKDKFIDVIMDNMPLPPPNYNDIVEINKKGRYEDIDIARLEAGANRCGVGKRV